jgi:hypothetical protein
MLFLRECPHNLRSRPFARSRRTGRPRQLAGPSLAQPSKRGLQLSSCDAGDCIGSSPWPLHPRPKRGRADHRRWSFVDLERLVGRRVPGPLAAARELQEWPRIVWINAFIFIDLVAPIDRRAPTAMRRGLDRWRDRRRGCAAAICSERSPNNPRAVFRHDNRRDAAQLVRHTVYSTGLWQLLQSLAPSVAWTPAFRRSTLHFRVTVVENDATDAKSRGLMLAGPFAVTRRSTDRTQQEDP